MNTDPDSVFEIRNKLGVGFRSCVFLSCRGFGEVFLARDLTSKELVAIKKLRLVHNSSMLINEGNTLRKCNSRYIVHYYGMYEKESMLWVPLCCCVYR